MTYRQKTKNILLTSLIFITSSLITFSAAAAQLAIVIDDFGYRKQDDNRILELPPQVSIAILPNSPFGKEMAEKAHRQGREILIHMPMAPISKQPLERDTLRPSMSAAEIDTLIKAAIARVPYATGMNNHMGSAMTSDLAAMQHVMTSLSGSGFYFLDSVTIGSTKVTQAAQGTPVRVLRRQVFLDNVQTEEETRKQLNRAVALARKQGSVIAIGHPHPSTVRALHKLIPQLPPDIQLVSPGYMLTHAGKPSSVKPQPEKPVVPVKPAEQEKPWLTPMTEQCAGQAEIGGEFYVRYINLLAEAVMRDQLNGNVAEVLSSIRMALPQPDVTPPAAKESVSTDLKAAEKAAEINKEQNTGS
ncbi:divergent polysaccharide deacetylase family protein [Morganella morganii]|nr:divergent polysaccharide deacetylase family protein [Morganella morganii]